MIDDEYIKQKRALADAAKPGPWKEHIGAIAQLTDGGAGYPLGFYPDSADIVMLRCEECGESTKMTADDVAFVADARTTVPELLDEVERLRDIELTALPLAKNSREFNRKRAIDLERERDVYRETIRELLGSATPNRRDHPAMSEAWARATALLENEPMVPASLELEKLAAEVERYRDANKKLSDEVRRLRLVVRGA